MKLDTTDLLYIALAVSVAALALSASTLLLTIAFEIGQR